MREEAVQSVYSRASTPFGPIDGNNHFFRKSGERLFAIAIRGGRRRPDFMRDGDARADFLFFPLAERARASLFPPLQLRLGGGEIAQTFFSFCFQSACNESVPGSTVLY